jgi:Mlc titration factor MtfA (ptsG expression regulator)
VNQEQHHGALPDQADRQDGEAFESGPGRIGGQGGRDDPAQQTHGEGGDGRNVLGMVGTGAMNRIMILVKPDLIQGFRNAEDKRNVGVHEFAHLVDKSDGVVDGLPGVGLDREAIGPWIDLVRRKMQEISDDESDINRYALTNEAEFFSVVSEYFFERPGLMKQKHPELFAMLQKVFRQDLGCRLKDSFGL